MAVSEIFYRLIDVLFFIRLVFAILELRKFPYGVLKAQREAEGGRL